MPIRLTRQGFEDLKKELNHLKTVKRPEVIKDLAEARALGDLRENAEYETAKELQNQLEKRIADLTAQLMDAAIIDEDRIDKDKAYLGARVVLLDLVKKKELSFVLVSKEEADLARQKISFDSPVGRALLGRKVGEEVEVKIPAGTLRYKIVKVERE